MGASWNFMYYYVSCWQHNILLLFSISSRTKPLLLQVGIPSESLAFVGTPFTLLDFNLSDVNM